MTSSSFLSADAAHHLDIVIMAAGKGTRMKSHLPKVLHRLAGFPMLHHVIQTAAQLKPRQMIIVTGHSALSVQESVLSKKNELLGDFHDVSIQFALQEPQLGTGHAVEQALPFLDYKNNLNNLDHLNKDNLNKDHSSSIVLILNGDVPLISKETILKLIKACSGNKLALLTVDLDHPFGYGRIIRKNKDDNKENEIIGIIEQKDANAEQLKINEVYTGIMAVPNHYLHEWIHRLDNHNQQKEYYLTDIVKMAVHDGISVVGIQASSELEIAGINSPQQLAQLERDYQLQKANQLMENGVRLIDPSRLDIRGTLTCGKDVEIDVNCVFSGHVELGDFVKIGANCVIANAKIENHTTIHPFCHIEGEKSGVEIGKSALIGPFSRLRPGTRLGDEVHIGNFVEVKNSRLDHQAKANHLAYIGDAHFGERVNFGAGAITANYDGANKHLTTIQADVHIGCNTVLVAPVTIQENGTVGAGSVISKNTQANALTLTRAKTTQIPDWERPTKNKNK